MSCKWYHNWYHIENHKTKGGENMEIKILIKCDNAAFAETGSIEAARILEQLAHRLETDVMTEGDFLPLRDINGNTVGSYEVI